MAGKFGHGTTLEVTVNSVLTAVAGLTSVGGLDLSSDEVDVTAHDSADGYREFEQGLKDGGSVEVEGNFYNDATQANLKTLFDSGEVVAMAITWPGTVGSWTFNAFVSGFSTDSPMDDKLSFTATVKVSGKPTLVEAGS